MAEEQKQAAARPIVRAAPMQVNVESKTAESDQNRKIKNHTSTM